MNHTTSGHKNTGDFYRMVEDYYKQHPEEAEEIGLKQK